MQNVSTPLTVSTSERAAQKPSETALRIYGAVIEAIEDAGFVIVTRERHEQLVNALTALEQWDMLTLDAEGHGQATADAPWARDLIAKALRG